MSSWKSLLLELFVNVEFLYSIHSSQILEAFNWDSWAPSHKLEKSSSQLHIKAFKYLEKPSYNLIILEIIYQLRISSEVFNINWRSSWNHYFKFFLVKNFNQLMRNKLMKTLQQSFKLMFNTCCHFGIWTQLDVLKLILFCYKDVCSSRYKLFSLDLTKVVKGVSKVEL